MAIVEIDLSIDPTNEALLKEKKEYENYILEETRPKCFDHRNRNNAIVANEKSYETLKALIEENGTDTKNLTVFEFYNRVEYLNKKNGNNK